MQFTKALAVIAMIPFQLLAQTQSLDPLNAAFAGKVVFKIDRQHRLVADFFDDTGRFRQDIAPLMELDAGAVSFSPEEDAVVLKCRSETGQCFTKEIFKLDVVRITGRSTLPRPADDALGEHAIGLLQEIIRSSQAELVQVAGETQNTRSRKNTR